MIFYLVDGKIKFLTHKVTWIEQMKRFNPKTRQVEIIEENPREQGFYSVEAKDAFLEKMNIAKIECTVIDVDQPSATLLAECETKTFNTYEDALSFVNGTYEEPITLESLAEIVADLIGGAI